MKISLVLLFLLKMLGFVLLILLAVLLLILLILLLTPIHYQLMGEKFEKLKGTFAVSWFFRLVQLKGEIKENGIFTFQLRLFGRPFWGDGIKEKDESRKKRKKEKVKKEKRKNKESPYPTEEDVAISMRSRETPSNALQDKPDMSSASPSSASPPTASPPTASPVVVDSLPKRVPIGEVLEKAPATDFYSEEIQPDELPEDFFTSETENKKGFREYYRKFQEIPHKKCILMAAVLLLKRLLKGVLPKDFYLMGTVGTGDPASTGYLCGLLGLLKMQLGNRLDITADFKEMTLRDVKISIRGKIVPGYFVYALLRFLLTKPVWHTIIAYWKGKR